MKSLVRTSAVLLPLVVALVLGGAARARSPDAIRTPTSTPTATPTAKPTPTPTPWLPLPPLPPEEVAKFSGEVWLETVSGRWPLEGHVTARVADAVCGDETVGASPCPDQPCVVPPSDPPPHIRKFQMDVVSAALKPGCGYEGAPVTFFLGDKQAIRTAMWHAGTSQEVNLTAGPPFAFFQGEFTLAFQTAEPIGVSYPAGMIALIGDNVCGQATRGIWRGRDPQGRDVYWYSVLVYSDEQQQGCGVEGDEVAFDLIWHGGPGSMNVGRTVAVAREKGVWHAWDGTPPEFNLTMYPVGVQLANVGDGGSRDGGAAAWADLSLGVSALGLLGIVAAAVLRKGSTTP